MADYSHLGEHVGASDVCMVCRNELADFTETGGQWCQGCAPEPTLQSRFERLIMKSSHLPIFIDKVTTQAENHIAYRFDGIITCHIVELDGQFVDDGDILRDTPAEIIIQGGKRFDTLEELVANIEGHLFA